MNWGRRQTYRHREIKSGQREETDIQTNEKIGARARDRERHEKNDGQGKETYRQRNEQIGAREETDIQRPRNEKSGARERDRHTETGKMKSGHGKETDI